MIRRPSVAALLFAAVIVPATVSGQSAEGYVGKWSLEYEVGRQIENGEATPIMGKGTFSIAKSADSLLVTIQPGQRADGTTPPQTTLGGRIVNGALTMEQQVKVRLITNGAEVTRDMVIRWSLTARGDAMTGTMTRAFGDDAEAMPGGPVTGTRLKG